jgi:radical SAM superfamily enzyme YgiQ (UPF0313 family)
MTILLIQAPNVKGGVLNLPGREIPLSLCSLAAYLKRHGVDGVRILDLDFYNGDMRRLDEELAQRTPDLVGVTSYTANVEIAARIAARVKQRRPEAATVIGGFHASALPEPTLREFPAFDYAVAGEGEITLLELAQAIAAGREMDRRRPAGTDKKPPGWRRSGTAEGVAGLYARRNDEVVAGPARPLIEDLDALPFPDRSLVPVAKYVPDPGNFFQLPSTGILFSRGCPFHCAYCAKAVFRDRLRYRSADAFVDEVEQCGRDFGIRDFRLGDEGPTANPRKMVELCETILRRGVRLTWNCFSRLEAVDAPLLSLMRRAGCYHIIYGMESAAPATLARIGKNVDLDRAEQAVRLAKQSGIECKVNFIFGFPWETIDDMRVTLRAARRLSPDLVSFNGFKPLPGSPLYDEMTRLGQIHHRRWSDYFVGGGAVTFDAAYTEAELRRLLGRAFVSFHLRPRYLAQRFRRVLRHPRRELRTIAGGLLVLARVVRAGF